MDNVRTISISLIRHAQTVYQEGILPPYDPDISLDGIDEALTSLAAALPDDALWLVSPLSRCGKTAEAIINQGSKPKNIKIMPALEEQRYGTWHGRPIADIWDEVKDGPKSNWHFLHPSVTPPQGESFFDLIARIEMVMTEIKAMQDDHIVIITHAMVIRAMVGLAMRLSPEQSLAIGVEPLSLTRMTYMVAGASENDDAGGRWNLSCLNQLF